ncbi:MAG: protein kinase [Terracidiphilus sp.]
MENVSFGRRWEGRVVEGRFPLLEWLEGSESRGLFFTVLQGLQEAVIELISAGGAEADAYIAQWDFAMALSHPHLVKIFAAGRCVIDGRDLVYVVTERSYSTLAKTLQSRALKADSAKETFIPVLNAVSYLHENGVIHGHINPLNIWFANSKPKLSVADLLKAGSAKRTIETPGNYDAPELMGGVATKAADTWSIGMTLWEAMTRARNKDPEAAESLPVPFREIVQECLRVDPLRRCTIQSIVERLEGSKSVPVPEDPIPVKIDSPPRAPDEPLRAVTPIPATKNPIPPEPEALLFPEKEFENTEDSDPVLFSKSLTHFEEKSRFRFLPYAVLVLAVIALTSFLLVRGHKTETPPLVASQNRSVPATAAPEKESAAQGPPATNQAQPATSPSVSAPQPEVAPAGTNQTQPAASPSVSQPPPGVVPQPGVAPQTGVPPQVQSAPTPAQPAPTPPSTVNHPVPRGKTEGLVAQRVIPTVSPGARSGMRRPVEVLIRVSVNQDGAVSDAAYMSHGPGNYFARLAQRAAESWKFKPPTRNGNPERSVWTLRFNFEREKTEVTATEDRE